MGYSQSVALMEVFANNYRDFRALVYRIQREYDFDLNQNSAAE